MADVNVVRKHAEAAGAGQVEAASKAAGPRPRRTSRALRKRLYDRVRYHPYLRAEALARYREANRLGGAYARWLERRFVTGADIEGLLRELRRSYRLSGGEKLAYLGGRARQ